MTRRRILYWVALVAALLFQIFNDTYLPHFILALVVAVPILGFILSLPAMLGCQVQVIAAQDQVTQGEAAAWQIYMQNRFPLPLARLTMVLHIQNAFSGTQTRQQIRLRGVPQQEHLVQTADTSQCGRLLCRCERIWVCDCLGLFALRRPASQTQLTVLPAEVDVALPATLDKMAQAQAAPPHPVQGASEDYDLRPYRPGDPLRAIHWKLSAKWDGLVVRENMEGNKSPVLVSFDRWGEPEDVVRALGRLLSVCRKLLKAQYSCIVQWADGQAEEGAYCFPIEDEAALTACITAAMDHPLPAQAEEEQALSISLTGTGSPVPHVHILSGKEDGLCLKPPILPGA